MKAPDYSNEHAFRRVVRTEPDEVYKAEEECIVHVWMPTVRADGEQNPACLCKVKNEKPDQYKEGLSLTDTIIIPFWLNAGEKLWAWSLGEGLINLSVVPR